MSRRAEQPVAPARSKGGGGSTDAATTAEPEHYGHALVSHFYMVAKTAAMFDLSNVVTREAIQTFQETLAGAFRRENKVILQTASDCVFVNERRLKIDFEGFAAFKYVIEALKGRDIGSVSFERSVNEAELSQFLKLFIENDHSVEEPRLRILSALKSAGISSIHLEETRDLAEQEHANEVSQDHRDVAINTYFKSVFVAKQFLENFREVRTSYMRKARRLVHSIVDIVAQDDTTLLALTQIKNFDNFLFSHSANVCVHSVVLGQNLGLDRTLLANLGLAALLHDVGMTLVPKGTQGRLDSLSSDERILYEQHPLIGARTIIKTQGISPVSIRCALVAFEHHLQEDCAGFPKVRSLRELSLFSRIVAITDFYDTVTTPDADGSPRVSAEEALHLMAQDENGIFDPLLVKLFVNSIGTYPLGTAVRLSTGEIAIVHRRSTDVNQFARPVVKIIVDGVGMAVRPEIVDLNEVNEETGAYKRSILEVLPTTGFFEGVQEFTELL